MSIRRIGQIFVDLGFIDDYQLEMLLEEQQQRPGELLGKIALELSLITDDQLAQALAEQMGLQVIQLVDVVVPPATRAELCGKLAASGLPRVEVASFVRDELVPAMAGAEEVVAGLPAADGTSWSGLVLNERGYDRLAATPLAEVHATFGVTETFQHRNAGSTVAGSLPMMPASEARSVPWPLPVALRLP